MFAGIVGLIILAISVTALIDFTQSNQTTDPRARANSQTGLMSFVGTVAQYDQTKNIIVVNSLMFDDSNDAKSLGIWSVTPPFNFNSIQFPPGTKIKIKAQPSSFLVSEKTLTAREIEKN